MEFTTEELQELRKSLPRGSAQVLANRLQMKVGSIRNILSGTTKNPLVLVQAVELAKEIKNSVQNAKAEISNL